MKWFNSYYEQNLPYLMMAQKYHISEYVIGTEMKELTPDKGLTPFLARAGKVFMGQISYTQWKGIYFAPENALPPTNLTGVDMYEALNLPVSASAAAVTAAYERFFADMPASLLARTAIQETGIEARDGAYANPPNLRTAGSLDESVQYNWFIAGCEAVKRFQPARDLLLESRPFRLPADAPGLVAFDLRGKARRDGDQHVQRHHQRLTWSRAAFSRTTPREALSPPWSPPRRARSSSGNSVQLPS